MNHVHFDADIETALEKALRENDLVPGTVKVTVNCGSVILTGDTLWNYQSEAAEETVRQEAGVASVHNRIHVESQNLITRPNKKLQAPFNRQPKGEEDSTKAANAGLDGEISNGGFKS
jgi:osmotically-inducible protein OsmY